MKNLLKKLNRVRLITFIILLFIVLVCNITYFLTYSDHTTDFNSDGDYRNTGIYGDTVYINRHINDYDYYMGLNYTYSSDYKTPTRENKNIFNDNNLVSVKISYSGDGFYNVGYVSTTERVNKYMYFRMMAVDDNDTTSLSDDFIDIELIDNPFLDRPTDLAFNGWITDYRGAFVSFDSTTYTRHVRVPVTYTNNVPDTININFNASWTYATVYNTSSGLGTGWTTANNNLNAAGMEPFASGGRQVINAYSVYTQETITTSVRKRNNNITVQRRGTCTNCYASDNNNTNYYYRNNFECPQPDVAGRPNGTYSNTCTVYYQNMDPDIDEDVPVYDYTNGMFSPTTLQYVYSVDPRAYNIIGGDLVVAGFYKKVHLDRNTSQDGYYSNLGAKLTGNCTATNGCEVYDLMQYYNNGEVNKYVLGEEYYYLVTRDTNLIYLNNAINTTWNSNLSKPFTLTGINNHVKSNSIWSVNGTTTAYNNMGINSIIINAGATTNGEQNAGATSPYFIGNFYNIKFGRGITPSATNRTTFTSFLGSNSGGTQSTLKEYRVIIESGMFNSGSLSSRSGSGGTMRVHAVGTYGSDYDLANNDNSKLTVRTVAAGSWAGTIYSDSSNTVTNNNEPSFDLTVLSGSFGTNRVDYTNGIYVGGLNGGTHNSSRRAHIFGGYIYNLIGGPLTSSNRADYNDTYMYIRGGNIDIIVGGAGRSETYGNRIIQITDGTINYAIFGGSNGVTGSGSEGTLSGDAYIYIGGNAIIGNESYVNNNAIEGTSKVEAGSVFGAGNGKTGSLTIGSTDNSYIVVNGGVIRRNIYGGGNYGTVGNNGNFNTNNTDIVVLKGTINGNIYGGGNQNGSGSTNSTSTVNIRMSDGLVRGDIYGGSNISGTVYGTSNVNILSGTVTGNVYGGGQGNGTRVRDNVNVNIGDINSTNLNNPSINSVYGGSAFGYVNGTSTSSTNYNTIVTINSGQITNVFGGAEGSNQYRPYVLGDVTVNINNGNITNVYGGNDLNGSPNKAIRVNVNNGNITNVFGGGNETGANSPIVTVNNGNITKVFGGSNNSGDVTTSNVTIHNGNVGSVYGGNNLGGTTGTTNVTVNNGDVGYVFGGGEQTDVTTSTNVNINNSCDFVFGGSNLMGNVNRSNVNINNGTFDDIFGGNNLGGTTVTSYVNLNGGVITNVYGGGLKASTTTTNINASRGDVTNLFGGGSEAGATTTNVNLGNTLIDNVFGGSNVSGNVNTSNIKNISGSIPRNGEMLFEYNISPSDLTPSNGFSHSYHVSVTINNLTNRTINSWNLNFSGSDANILSNDSNTLINTNGNTFSCNSDRRNGGVNAILGNSSYTFEFDINSNSDNFMFTSATLSGVDSSNNNVSNKKNVGNVYGGNNLGGVTTNSRVDLTSLNYQNIYGGGKKASVNNVSLKLSNVNVSNNVFGGGDEASVNVCDVDITSSTIKNVYGGGNFGEVLTNTDVLISESNITDTIYGGGNNADIDGNVILNVLNNSTINDLYGGGNLGSVNGTVTVNVKNSNSSGDIYGGGNRASVGLLNNTNDEVMLTIDNITARNIFGGANASSINGNVVVDINNSIVSGNIYGGGNGANSQVNGDETNELNPAKVLGNITLDSVGSSANDVFGGGNLGLVLGNTHVHLRTANGRSYNSVYGGGNNARVNGSTVVNLENVNINVSAYAGGNGNKALVRDSASISVHGTSHVTYHVFGGGNAAETGEGKSGDKSIVNLAGGIIGGNIYGGPNTSKINGSAEVNIGKNAVSDSSLIKGDISIGGTVFGGGEANASGSEIYDYNFISVTEGIRINIDGGGHSLLKIEGSIFGSGNASSSAGRSEIYISNYGTKDAPWKNISIQRANLLTLDHAYFSLMGATDRTNEYNTVLFTLSRIDEMKMINDNAVYLRKGANLLQKISSYNQTGNTLTKGYVRIDSENNTVTRNANNRLYMYEGENLNIATNQNVTQYGEVYGMFFFGMYLTDRLGNNISTALYSDYEHNEEVPAGDFYYFTNGSYVLGKHNPSHDITVDGFFSNYPNEENNNRIQFRYIEPTPPDSEFYIWSVGEVVASYDVTLTASKYSTLGVQEVPLFNHATPNTIFSILGVNSGALDPGIRLVDYNTIPRVAANESDANSIFGISMKSGTSGWLTNGSTIFLSEGLNQVVGTTEYIRENLNNTPSFLLYFYHSKNITSGGSLGSVTVSLMAITPIDDLNNEVERININIDLTKALYNTNDYEGTITPGKQYEMFGTSPVDITTKSSFSTYYSLFIQQNTSPYKTGYHRSLVSTYVMPVDTSITMIDLHDKNNPIYYYYNVNQSDYNDNLAEYNLYGECSIDLSKFIKMGSTSSGNNYNDATNNTLYYNNGIAEEEFIFIVDFLDSNITSDVIDKKLLIELRDNASHTLIGVLGVEQDALSYNLYANSDAYVELDGSSSRNTIYQNESTVFTIDSNFVQTKVNNINIFDTRFEEEKLGFKISIYDENNNLMSSQDLLGAYFTFNGVTYYPRYDGTTRIKITDRVGNARTRITFNTGTSNLSTGNYKFAFESFGSYDGVYYGSGDTTEEDIYVGYIATPYGLKVTLDDTLVNIKKEGLNSLGNDDFYFRVQFTSTLNNPILRVKLQRRDYSSIYSSEYVDVDFKDYFDCDFETTNFSNEYLLSNHPSAMQLYSVKIKENLMSGTYKMQILLYDQDVYIGNVNQYIVIK